MDETKFVAARRREPTRWASAICDVARRTVVDVIEGRQAPDLETWLTRQPHAWREGVKVTVTDLHEPFRTALAAHLPNATAVADAFHVVGVGTRVVDRTRRRIQQETLGHRATLSTAGASSSASPPNASTTPPRPSCEDCSPPLRILLACGGCNWALLGTPPR